MKYGIFELRDRRLIPVSEFIDDRDKLERIVKSLNDSIKIQRDSINETKKSYDSKVEKHREEYFKRLLSLKEEFYTLISTAFPVKLKEHFNYLQDKLKYSDFKPFDAYKYDEGLLTEDECRQRFYSSFKLSLFAENLSLEEERTLNDIYNELGIDKSLFLSTTEELMDPLWSYNINTILTDANKYLSKIQDEKPIYPNQRYYNYVVKQVNIIIDVKR